MATITVTYPGVGVEAQTDIQAAIDGANEGDTVIIPAAAGDWVVAGESGEGDEEYRWAITLKTGVNIQIDGTIAAKEGSFLGELDCLIGLDRVSDIVISGTGIVKMQKAEYLTGERRHCVSLHSASNITIEGSLTFKDSGGDGLYIGPHEVPGPERVPSRNILVTGLTCENNRRDGCSVISVQGLTMRRCYFTNTIGTAPQAGLNLEPEDNAEDRLGDVLIEDCVAFGNASRNFFVNFSQMWAGQAPINVIFRRCNSPATTRNPRGFHCIYLPTDAFVTQWGSPTGTLRWEDCRADRLTLTGIKIEWRPDCNIELNFENFQLAGVASLNTEKPIAFTLYNGTTINPLPLGRNMVFNGMVTDNNFDRKITSTVYDRIARNLGGTIHLGRKSTGTSQVESLLPNLSVEDITFAPARTLPEYVENIHIEKVKTKNRRPRARTPKLRLF